MLFRSGGGMGDFVELAWLGASHLRSGAGALGGEAFGADFAASSRLRGAVLHAWMRRSST